MNITPAAEQKINQTLSGTECLRVEVNGGGCSGFTVGLARMSGAEKNDIWLNKNVVIDSTSAGYLSEATLDWIDDPFKSTFHFKIPNTKSCGCGDSFQFEGE
jgi:iron-sulfur cluster assembly accessory protein